MLLLFSKSLSIDKQTATVAQLNDVGFIVLLNRHFRHLWLRYLSQPRLCSIVIGVIIRSNNAAVYFMIICDVFPEGVVVASFLNTSHCRWEGTWYVYHRAKFCEKAI
jgi:hypothetical protein